MAQCVSVPKTYVPFELSLYFWPGSEDQIMHLHVVRIILVLNFIFPFFGGGGGGGMVKYDKYNNEFGTKEKRSNQG